MNSMTTADGKTKELGTTVTGDQADLESLAKQVDCLYNSQAINALQQCAGQIAVVKWPPKPVIQGVVAGMMTSSKQEPCS